MAIDKAKFNGLLNNIASVNFTKADNVAYPARRACLVCGQTPGSSATGWISPMGMTVVATGAPCPQANSKISSSGVAFFGVGVPTTPTGSSHWVSCFVPAPNSNQKPNYSLLLRSDLAPPLPSAWLKVGPVGSTHTGNGTA